MAPHRVNFINENQARRILLALLEHVTNAARADAHKHLHKIRTADAEKRHVRFPGNRLRQQRLPRSRRPHHQHTLRNVPAQPLKLPRVLQKFHQLPHFFLRLVTTSHLLERHLVLVHRQQPRPALPEAHRPAPRHLDLLTEKEPQHPQQQQHRQQAQHEARPHVVVVLVIRDNPLLVEQLVQPLLLHQRIKLHTVRPLRLILPSRERDHFRPNLSDLLHALLVDLVLLHHVHKPPVLQLLSPSRTRYHQPGRQQPDRDRQYNEALPVEPLRLVATTTAVWIFGRARTLRVFGHCVVGM